MAFIKRFSISGFRSFGELQHFHPAVPDNSTPCSGLTIIVGPNNAGKSTLLEAIDEVSLEQSMQLPKQFRHEGTEYRVRLEMLWSDGQSFKLEPKDLNVEQLVGASSHSSVNPERRILGIGPHRLLPDSVEIGSHTRESWVPSRPHLRGREPDNSSLVRRVPHWQSPKFKKLLHSVIDFEWWMHAEGRSASVRNSGNEHQLSGFGNGMATVLYTVDALFDAPDGSTVVIDEPEIALHPSYQRRLLNLLKEQSSRIQIIYATHSPYMADWATICGGAKLVRVARPRDGYAEIHELTKDTADQIGKFLDDVNNPHLLGTNAADVFFLADGVILVEGQEDVVCYRKMAKELGIELKGEFFGWGVGGASKAPVFLKALQDLGYSDVFTILDGDMEDTAAKLRKTFPDYKDRVISKKNARDKKGPKDEPDIKGLCNRRGEVHEECKAEVSQLLNEINEAFKSAGHASAGQTF